ncbi:MAG TPA: PhnD/SsuA/transferrin family substrate-binding protein [Gemmataceae bacterium]|nr:PhnD/SsuA/transferrin family substrate-binding protein [Gemmataceae bacterium]
MDGASASGAGEDGSLVRIGLVRSLFRDTSEPLMQVIMRPFKSLMEAQTGMSGQLVAAGEASNLAQRLKSGDCQLGIFHGFEFAWARQIVPELKPLLIAVPKQQRRLFAHLVVRAESVSDRKVKSVADLKGQVVALPYMSREHCRLFLERRCVPAGNSSAKFFSRISVPRDATDAIDDVIAGTTAAAVIDGDDLESYRSQYPEYFAKVKVLLQSEAFPCAVIAYYPGKLSQVLLDRFREGMLSAKDSRQARQVMQLCRISSFEDFPADFDKMLDDIAKAYPPSASK